ncbi:hypothetical protein BTO06_13605 [Tenacibaculum sp. SZ-18]|uniref:hypothetical protein n=1 Tax=Tenacibaculum sp. SZ-18 TaxID=754423 RepID=UPI000C2D2881|nr:hypothetical protein [Tenacibaculum sp. SZ-18]AUC16130.1 hypothetical protein BTO06_13605 [Tenacibaculum sp. SZ-18]
MKKVILSVFVAGSLLATSCKNAKETEEKVNETTEAVVEKTEEVVEKVEKAVEKTEEVVSEAAKKTESAIEGITIPEFKDPKAGEYLASYAEYAKKKKEAGTDALKTAELAKTGADLAAKAKEVVAGLDEESTKKFNSVLAEIKAKLNTEK